MILLSSRFLKKEKERKYWVHPILRYREDGEFPLLIKEQRDYHGQFKVYFRMSVAVNFCEFSVQGSIYSTLCCETKWMNLAIAILDFSVHLYGGSELSKHLSKYLLRMRKMEKNRTRSKFFYDGWKFRRQCVNVIDITWGRIYFFNVQIFRTIFSDSVCNDLYSPMDLLQWMGAIRIRVQTTDKNITIIHK